MTYFPDLSLYTYWSNGSPQTLDKPTVNIGWLDIAVPYPQGETPRTFQEKLKEFCVFEATVKFTWGFHECQFCKGAARAIGSKTEDERRIGGCAEIRVIGHSRIYAAPTLVYHYVTEHQYHPPGEFIAAVLTGPGPTSEEHRRLVAQVR